MGFSDGRCQVGQEMWVVIVVSKRKHEKVVKHPVLVAQNRAEDCRLLAVGFDLGNKFVVDVFTKLANLQ